MLKQFLTDVATTFIKFSLYFLKITPEFVPSAKISFRHLTKKMAAIADCCPSDLLRKWRNL